MKKPIGLSVEDIRKASAKLRKLEEKATVRYPCGCGLKTGKLLTGAPYIIADFCKKHKKVLGD